MATYFALPAVPLTSSSNTFTLSIPAKCPFLSFGTIFTATSPKPHQTSHYTPPTMTWSASSTQFHSTDLSMRFTLSSTTGNNSNSHTPSRWMSRPPATRSTTHTLADIIENTLPNAPSRLQTSPPSWLLPSTHAFSGLATILINKSEGPGLDPSSLQPYAMSPSPSLSIPGTRSIQHTDLHFTYYRYVDNRFIVHNEHFLQHPAIQTLIHHNFFGDPVELEPVEDFHLLGFNIDLPQRTITYMQPSQPWKIRDSTTAGSQRLALSGLQSRLHTIRKYTFPPSSAEAAAAELVRLYVQKGHNHHACHRFLKKAPDAATCVCPPLDKGFSTTTPYRQGRVALPPYHTQRSCGREWEAGPDQPCVPAVLSSCDSTLPLVCCHGGSMIPPQNLPFAAFVLQLSRADRSFSRLDQQLVETPTSLSDSSPCSSVTFLPSVGTEFTEYKCQSVLCFVCHTELCPSFFSTTQSVRPPPLSLL